MKRIGEALSGAMPSRTAAREPAEPADGAADECPICRGAGWLRANAPVGHPMFGRPIMCECLMAEVERRRVDELRRFSALEAFRDQTFANFDRKIEGTEAAYVAARSFARDDSEFRWLILRGPPGTGKCVAASEVLTLANGLRVRAADLIGQTFTLLTLTEGGITPVAATAKFNALEPVYALEVAGGHRIVRNANHPLWVGRGVRAHGRVVRPDEQGWRPLAEIQPGDFVALAIALPAFPECELPVLDDDAIIFLAYYLGDGGGGGRSVWFTQQDNLQLAEFRAVVERQGCSLASHGKYTWRVVGPSKKATANPMINLLRDQGLVGLTAREKRVPPAIWTAPRRQLALFLNRLYATDGWAHTQRNGYNGRHPRSQVGYGSSSLRLASEVQELLLKLGIRARRYPHQRGHNAAFQVNVCAPNDVLTFADVVGIYGKEEAVARARDNAAVLLGRKRGRIWHEKSAPPGTYFDRVTAITSLGVQPTVAIEVPEHHTYLTAFYEHNTHLAAAIANEAVSRRVPVLFSVVPDLLDHMRSAYAPTSSVKYDDMLEGVRTTELLVLDDLGTENATPWAQEKLYQIINHRYNNVMPTVITTNRRLDALDDRVHSRICDQALCKVVEIGAGDYRALKPGQRRPGTPGRPGPSDRRY